MKKFSVLFIVMISMLAATVAAQSVADAARQNRASKKADSSAKVIDNDVIPSVIEKPSLQTASTAAKSDTQKDAKAQDKPAAATEPEKKSASADNSADSWKKKVAEQKHEIAQLQREVDVAERESRLRAAAFYADAGVMLRDQERYAQDNRKAQSEIDSKKQTLSEARQKLEDLQEQARKAGVSASQLD